MSTDRHGEQDAERHDDGDGTGEGMERRAGQDMDRHGEDEGMERRGRSPRDRIVAREQVVLGSVPSLGGLYARTVAAAAGAGVRRALPGRRRPAGADAGGSTGVRHELPAVEHVVEGVVVDGRGHEAFRRAVGAPLRQGPGGTEAFSGYLHALAFPVALSVLTRPDFPLPLLRTVHLANAVEHRAAVAVGEDLTATATAEDLRPHRAGARVDVVVRLARQDGEEVWTGRSTYLARGVRVPGEAEAAPRAEFVPPAPTAQWRLGAGAGRDYAAVSGDWNPIHLSGPSARALGMKGAIAHGMYCASRVLADVRVPAGTPFRWTVEFAAPVPLPGTVAVSIDDDGRGAQWTRSGFAGWDPRRGRPHFTGTVERLGG